MSTVGVFIISVVGIFLVLMVFSVVYRENERYIDFVTGGEYWYDTWTSTSGSPDAELTGDMWRFGSFWENSVK